MIKNDNPFLTEKNKIALAMNNAGDGQGLILDMSGKTAEDVIRDENIKKANKEIEVYADSFNKHVKDLEESTNKLSLNPENVEIMPIGNYVLIKEFKTNPFQRIVQDKNGIITDLGGAKPIFKSTDSGEFEEEEAFILCGVVQEIGPECKWIRPTDAVFFTKPSMVPIPFYRAGLVLVNETRILSVINEGLTERFNKIKNDK